MNLRETMTQSIQDDLLAGVHVLVLANLFAKSDNIGEFYMEIFL